MYPTPEVCYNCQHTDLSNLYVCSSRACGANNAFCDESCIECLKELGQCGGENPHYNISCWQQHMPRGKTALAHQKQPARDQVRINEVFYCEKNPERQSELHAKDKEARWFMVDPRTDQQTGDGILRVTDRFEELLQPRSENSSKQFPSLVSFIGETGTGKSTLIRASIKFFSGQAQHSETLETPVTRLEAASSLTSPTSSGVHLYKDPATFASPTPILFADCEGFNSGAGLPTSHTAWDSDGDTVARAIRITSSTYSSAGRQLALSDRNTDLYSRFLYAFSDVVCLVTRNAQKISKEISDLLLWAYRGLRASINQVQAKTLIIVLNAPSHDHNPSLMSPIALHKYIFDNMPKVWDDSEELKEERKKLNDTLPKKDEINSTESFILRYFQSIRVCYIPTKGSANPDEMHKQCQLLRSHITESVDKTSKEKEESWTRYSIRDLSQLLNQAFEHFATDDNPFNFYKATRKDNPNPQSMQDHIMNMLRNLEMTRNRDLINHFPKLVASSILNNCLRGSGPALGPEVIWTETYEEKCTVGIENFYKQHADCQFQKEGLPLEFCAIKKHVHKSIHRSKDGSLIGTGDFLPSDTGDIVRERTSNIGKEFGSSYKYLCRRGEGRSVERIIAHRKEVLRSPHHELWGLVRSYKTCFSCLLSCPDHVLPCGHALCERCISDFGKPSNITEREIEINECVFCGESWERKQRIQTKPPFAGVRILTLDGGGIRGILELLMLKEIQERIGLNIRFDQFFDLVVGTSTGGIIALGLFVQRLSLENMIRKFEDLSAILYMTGLWESTYRTSPLREGIQDVVGEKWSMFGSAMGRKVQRRTRVALMTVKDSGKQAAAITNYNRPSLDQNNDFERAEGEEAEIKCWEAGLCTSAAPFYFKPFKKVSESATVSYLDGGILHNNPIRWAAKERDKIWPNAKLDILLSLGTGYFPNRERIRETSVYARFPSAQAVANSYFSTIDCESTWSDFREGGEYDPEVHHRLNHKFDGEYYALDNYQAINILANIFKESLEVDSTDLDKQLQHSADLLVAKLFFFEPTKIYQIPDSCASCRDEKKYRVEGSILCRLPKGSIELKILVQRIIAFSASDTPAEVEIERKTQIGPLKTFIKAVVDGGRFQIPHTITGFGCSRQIINVLIKCPGSGEDGPIPIPISGFPRNISELVYVFEAEKAHRYKWVIEA
ncbi:uncharacterized protein LAJ45_11462 [Morchella importuna]|uniref:uncharacterized protein n=1 Tax=Morchella importuna TaxID=1174673 RepID=UPI001E8DBE96|nr:uncharacterized protein LAJ45_11462 [Morchella importuna]KAH8144522.1 hypothetical protein LAJ45_11462 [Morchella importuna]